MQYPLSKYFVNINTNICVTIFRRGPRRDVEEYPALDAAGAAVLPIFRVLAKQILVCAIPRGILRGTLGKEGAPGQGWTKLKLSVTAV